MIQFLIKYLNLLSARLNTSEYSSLRCLLLQINLFVKSCKNYDCKFSFSYLKYLKSYCILYYNPIKYLRSLII